MSTRDEWNDFFDAVYSQDTPENPPCGLIQWKGTNVCMDTHCECGHSGHIDGYHVYFYRCPKCGRGYAVGAVVKLIPLTEEQAEYVKSDTVGFSTDNVDEE